MRELNPGPQAFAPGTLTRTDLAICMVPHSCMLDMWFVVHTSIEYKSGGLLAPSCMMIMFHYNGHYTAIQH